MATSSPSGVGAAHSDRLSGESQRTNTSMSCVWCSYDHRTSQVAEPRIDRGLTRRISRGTCADLQFPKGGEVAEGLMPETGVTLLRVGQSSKTGQLRRSRPRTAGGRLP